jgi:thiol-disulfide isomerase/thioredoxin
MKPTDPRMKMAIWFRRLSNIGFVIALAYGGFMAWTLFSAARNNAKLEGMQFKTVEISRLGEVGVLPVKVESDASVDGRGTGTARAFIFWASWCGPCHSLLDSLESKIKAGELDSERVFAVSMDETEAALRAHLQRAPTSVPVLFDPKLDLARQVQVSGTPTVALVDSSGKIIRLSTGGFGLAGRIAEHVKPQSP